MVTGYEGVGEEQSGCRIVARRKFICFIAVSDRSAYGFPTARTSLSLPNGIDFIVVKWCWPLLKGQDLPVRGHVLLMSWGCLVQHEIIE